MSHQQGIWKEKGTVRLEKMIKLSYLQKRDQNRTLKFTDNILNSRP